MTERRRLPKRVYARGSEPDARFTLANERTFLAWISTSLALLSVGVALESLALDLHPTSRLAASLALIAGGIACSLQAWFGWTQVETALREHRPLPFPRMVVLLPIIVGVAGVLVVAGLVLG